MAKNAWLRIALVLLGLQAVQAQAFTLMIDPKKDQFWQKDALTVHVDSATCSGYPNTPNIVDRGMGCWNGVPTSRIKFSLSNDEHADVVIFCGDISIGPLAETQMGYSGTDLGGPKRIIQVDVIIDTLVLEKNDDYAAMIACHELGHALGLGHSMDSEAVMYSNPTPVHMTATLGQDDIDAATVLYPRNELGGGQIPLGCATVEKVGRGGGRGGGQGGNPPGASAVVVPFLMMLLGWGFVRRRKQETARVAFGMVLCLGMAFLSSGCLVQTNHDTGEMVSGTPLEGVKFCDGSGILASYPLQPTGLESGVTVLGVGYFTNCAVKQGKLYCWGFNGQAQAGTDNKHSDSICERSTYCYTPLEVKGIPGTITQIAIGNTTSCALAGGDVYCWGGANEGQLGTNDTARNPVPQKVHNINSQAVSISAGAFHMCAAMSTGAVKCWGGNVFGQALGQTGLSTKRCTESGGVSTTSGVECVPEPVTVPGMESGALSVASGGVSNCSLMQDGTIKCWGSNNEGQLGNGNYSVSCAIINCGSAATLVSGLTSGVRALASGFSHVCAKMDSGALKCWGRNGSAFPSGELGIDPGFSTQCKNMKDSDVYDLCVPTPTDVTTLADVSVSLIAAGSMASCAVLTTGEVRCWGQAFIFANGFCHDSVGTPIYRYNPVKIMKLPSGMPTSIGVGNGHACVLIDGGVWCWGGMDTGEIGRKPFGP
ncbi:matrixin family metalloprotease [Bdellovibrionota bacterium FG-1]